MNPHITFHPSDYYYHVRANGQEELFAGLLPAADFCEEAGWHPWIRVVSNPVSQLKLFSRSRAGASTEILELKVESENCSLQLNVDFVDPKRISIADVSPHVIRELKFGEYAVRLSAIVVHPQEAKFFWTHEH